MVCTRPALSNVLTFRFVEIPNLHRRTAISWHGRPWIVNRPMNARIFETWIETQLAPTLSHGDVVILDNVAFHKSERAEELGEAKGARLLFLPPYSPDLNPIEMAFSKLKMLLRKWRPATSAPSATPSA